ncbi:hypothetical protein GAY33_26690 [Azospirillum brasilense]|uniref:hypothetical protein n=1 Tax=Azospirillum argentinense TaxID=2970906 RepID=UPI00190E6F54|nr:hypothetical protein [Azospirillum argentinense]MBK3802751.1 hypothetical protein [Azospirillum argentinense]
MTRTTAQHNTGKWADGLAEWTDGDTVCLSVTFTWRVPDAYQRARWHRDQGRTVRIGGPGVFRVKKFKLLGLEYRLEDVAQIGGEIAEAVTRHNPMATVASRGCPVGCHFCIVPKMEGREFTLLPDFVPRPVLCDNNLSALPAEYQEHIIARYQQAEVPLLDANSGFEPKTFDEAVFRRWRPINRGPWRFAFDEMHERADVERVMGMLRSAGVPQSKMRVYVLIGNEPFDACMERIRQVIAWGGEPYCQPYMKLNALEKVPHVRFDWTRRRLGDVARWANGRFWKYCEFGDFNPTQPGKGSTFDRHASVGDLFGSAA